MLKGFFDRPLMPGVAFGITDPAHVKPLLTHLKRIVAVVTYGRPRWMAWYMGDPPRKMVTRYMVRGGRLSLRGRPACAAALDLVPALAASRP